MSAENQKLFEEFVDYCSKLTAEHPEVIPFLKKCHSKVNASYLSSVEFRNTLGRCLTRVQGKQTKLYVYINELCTVLKNHSEKKKVPLRTQPATPQRDKVEAGVAKESVETENSKEEGETENTNEEVPEKKAGSKHQIRRLESLLRLYAQEIQKLQEKELSLDDMDDEDSTYIQESRLKQKMIRIYEKLCELKDCSSLTGRVIEQRIEYKGTRYKEVNRRLEKFINKTRDVFPDYGDILKVVQKANERHSLGLTRKHVQSIAQDAFRDLGNKLKDRRHLDLVYNFGSHLTDPYKSGEDPAKHDPSLARRLCENRSLALNRLEDVIKKFAEMQDQGDEEDWKNKNREEVPSTSKDVKDSSRSRRAQSHSSHESEEDEDEDEESEESDVDIEEELRQSQEAADDENEEDMTVDYSNETDQKMEETSDHQNSSPASKEEGENEESSDSDQDGDEEDTDKDEDQDLSSGSTSLSAEKEDQNMSLELEVEMADPASPCLSNDTQVVNQSQEDHAEQEKGNGTSGVTSEEAVSESHNEEQLEMSVVEEDFVWGNAKTTEEENVPYVEAKTPSSKEQCTDTQNLEKDTKTPTIKGKEGKFSRLDKCINKITGSLAHKSIKTEKASPVRSEQERFRHVNHKKLHLGGTPRTEEQSSNGKLVCVDTPGERWDPVRKIAFSQSSEKNSDVVHLDSSKNSTCSDTSNGVHKAMVVPSTPINRLKRKRDMNTPTETGLTMKCEEVGSNRRKRKNTSQLWTGNGVAKYKGEENGKEQKLNVAKLSRVSSTYTSYSSPSEPCSDNEHDITLDLMVTCSPQMTPNRTPSRHNKTDAATQCDPDEVIVLSD